MLNFALYLQCRALYLPPKNYNLSDPRIKAVIAAHNLGAGLYGYEGIRQIDRPILMVSGDWDVVSPVVTEQIFSVCLDGADPPGTWRCCRRARTFSSKPAGEGAGDVPSILMGGTSRRGFGLLQKPWPRLFWGLTYGKTKAFYPTSLRPMAMP